MLIPNYCFSNDFKYFYEYFLSQPHKFKTFQNGDYLWAPGEPVQRIHYICSGIAQTFVEHENGRRKILSFHSAGTIFPGCPQQSFKIENSIVTAAITDITTLEFTKSDFYTMLHSNQQLNTQLLESQAMYINLLIYEVAHQEYNGSFIKLCNLLYLFSQNTCESKDNRIDLTQESIADILAINRVNVAKNLSRLRDEKIIITHRKWIEIANLQALEAYCSQETLHQ